MVKEEATRVVALAVARQRGREIPGVSDWEEAQKLVREVVATAHIKFDTPEASDHYAKAQVDATLALVYEQRTANLIALLAQENLADMNYGYLLSQINERLDLK